MSAATAADLRGVRSLDTDRLEIAPDGRPALVGTRCDLCATITFAAHRACLACASPRVRRCTLAGRGRVLSYTRIHRASAEWWGTVPYVVAEVRTDDGVVVTAGMVGLGDGSVAVGAPVELACVVVEPSAPGAGPPAGSMAVYQWAPTGAWTSR